MGKGSKRRQGDNYEENYEAIFPKQKAVTSAKRFGESRSERSLSVLEDVKPFVSPIDGRVINTRSDLRVHNEAHGVTDSRDYSQDYFDKKAAQREVEANSMATADRNHRIEILRDRMN